MDCHNNSYSSGFCYKVIDNVDWFDAHDGCKQLGGEIFNVSGASNDSFIEAEFSNRSSYWLDNDFRYKFGVEYFTSNNNNGTHANTKVKRWEESSFDGLCSVLNKGNLTRKSCNSKANAVCKVPGK